MKELPTPERRGRHFHRRRSDGGTTGRNSRPHEPDPEPPEPAATRVQEGLLLGDLHLSERRVRALASGAEWARQEAPV